MDRNAFYYSGLTPLTALRLLTEFIEQDPSHVHVIQNDMGISLHMRGNTIAEVVLTLESLVPSENALRFLQQAHNRITGRRVEYSYHAPQAIHPLFPYLANLVIASKDPATGSSVSISRNETVLCGFSLSDDKAISVDRRLRPHATSVRVARADAHADTAGLGHFFFHVKHDESRDSTFRSAVQAGDFDECLRLNIHESVNGRILLPHDLDTDRQIIDVWVKFLRLYLDATGRAYRENTFFTAMTRKSVNQDSPIELLFLYDLDFLPVEEVLDAFRPSASAYLTLRDDAKALSNLANSKSHRKAGFQLRVHEITHIEADMEQYEQLKVDIQFLQMELEAVEGQLRMASPRLLRYEQDQLESLVAMLAAFHPENLENIYYGFFSGDKLHQEGVHYIYVPEFVPMLAFDPIFAESSGDRRKIEYWFDPAWRRHYAEEQTEALVFVPYGSQLFPSLQSWDISSIDEYLAAIFHDRQEYPAWMTAGQAITKPMYLFSESSDASSQLFLSILDFSQFQPVGSPKVIGWLNDNLTLVSHLKTHDFIQMMASEINKTKQMEAIKRRKSTFETEFAQSTQAMREQLAAAVEKLHQNIVEEVDSLIKHVKDDLKSVAKMNADLDRYRALHRVVTSSADEIGKAINSASSNSASVLRAMNEFRTQIAEAGNKAVAAQDEFIKLKLTKLEELESTRDRLHNELARLKATI